MSKPKSAKKTKPRAMTRDDALAVYAAGSEAVVDLLLGMDARLRTLEGRETNERLWTVVGTCALQGRSAFEFILQAVQAHFQNQPPPSLLPGST